MNEIKYQGGDMRSARLALMAYLFLIAVPIWAQQTATQPGTPPPPAPRDAQAVTVVTQALAIAGGIPAILAVTDYTASGNITYHQSPDNDVQGTVTMSGLGLNQFRLDATLPTGQTSVAFDSEGGIATKYENGETWRREIQHPMTTGSYAFPYSQLAVAFVNPNFRLSYKGLVEIDGHSVHDVQAQLIYPGRVDPTGVIAQYHTIDFFMEASTFQLFMTQDIVPRDLTRKLRYSDYRPTGGVLVPFSIDEVVQDQRIRTIHLDKISFNAGLQDSGFQF